MKIKVFPTYQGSMKSGRQKECVVTGTLCLMLRMSQLAGVAPIRFRRMHGGWCIRVSRLANFYGKSLSFMLWLLSTTTIAIDILIEPERSYRTRTNSTRIVWVADVGTVGLVVCTAAFTGFSRMKCLMVYLLKLQEINLKLSLYHDEPSNESARKLIAVSSMIFTCSTILLDFSIFIYQVATDHGKLFTSCMYIFYNISTAVQQVILLTFSETATAVCTSLLSLNNCLKNLLEQIVHDSPEARNSVLNQDCRIDIYNTISSKSINSVVDTMATYRAQPRPALHPLPIMIRRLGLLYCSLCDVVRHVNDSYGTVLVAMLLCLLLHLVITPYHVITNIFNKSRSDRSSPTLQLNWVVLHFINLLLIVEPCHRTHEEMRRTRHLISQMLRHTTTDNNGLLSELQIFYQHLSLNEVSYAPLKMFPLDRTLIVTILGSITTYLVVVVQL
ncbi:gustatory receptor for sugar taste 43a-like [Spodoptera litura]|uniref:Gustatory receptor n=1 Tax=Spodoptera litura TaxID=69820 RepID=A0A9J7ENG2_SPOLT|nr:gustatory receptor for sugar taste 43a-like [Spodoptera litura]